MGQFKVGDRVEIIDDIGHHYPSHIGIVTKERHRSMAVAQDVDVWLADGTYHRFFDFQLHVPAAIVAHVLFDSATAPQIAGTRGICQSRHLQFAADDFDLQITIAESEGHKTILGHIDSRWAVPESPLVTLLVENDPQQSTIADGLRKFAFDQVPPRNVSLEIFAPGRCIIAAFDVGMEESL